MTVLSVTDHDTVRLASKFPAESRRSALNHALSPTARVALSGTIVTVATGAGAVTTTSAEPLLPSLVAVRTADPACNALITAASPAAKSMCATLGSLTVHVTDRPLSGSPCASRSVAAKVALSPTTSVSAGGVTVTEATGAGAITTIWADPLLPSLVAVRTVDPGFNARTRGQLSDHAVSMRATVESLSVKLTARPYSGFPCASRSATWKRAVSPTIMVSVEGVTVTEATGGGADTSTSAEPLFPSAVAVRMADPALRARI